MQSTEAKHGRRAGIGISAALALMIVVALVRGRPVNPALPALLAALVLMILLRPTWLTPVERCARFMRSTFAWCLMVVAYFVILTPAALLRRLIVRDPLAIRLERSLSTYWIERPPEPDWAERLSRPY